MIRCCAASDLLAQLPDGAAHLMITDPPYGIQYKSNWRVTRTGLPRRSAASFGEDTLQIHWLQEAYRVLTDESALYLFTRWDVLHIWQQAIKQAGFKVVQRIVWDKAHFTMGNLNYYGSQTEDILFCVKGNHRLRWTGREGNIWRLTTLDVLNYEGNYDNPTQKPVRLLKRAIIRSSDRGQTVIDPFCGTGSTGVAAQELGRHSILGDISPEQIAIASHRLSLPFTPEMFQE